MLSKSSKNESRATLAFFFTRVFNRTDTKLDLLLTTVLLLTLETLITDIPQPQLFGPFNLPLNLPLLLLLIDDIRFRTFILQPFLKYRL
ncbi:hypothetical protein Hanom_Chr07g00600641 [Helianthus anomalus]